MKLPRRGQGATEYLLMLAAVLVIVAVAIYYVISTGPAVITGTATKNGDNVIFTPSDSMVPASISSTDWEWAIYRGTDNVAGGMGTGVLERGVQVILTAENAVIGDNVEIRYEGKWYEAATITPQSNT
jgi:hypothetical protein